jgi:hypothetical protein
MYARKKLGIRGLAAASSLSSNGYGEKPDRLIDGRENGQTIPIRSGLTYAESAFVSGPPEALVTRVDFGAGQLNGIALARMARHRHPSLAVVFVPRRDWGQLPGFNQSSQRSCQLSVSARQMPLQVFSSQGSCEASC